MKKYLLAALSLAATMCFTSCDDDDYQGMNLSGCWDGDFGMCYDYKSGRETYTVDADYTDIEFIPYSNRYSSGYGYQVDFYSHGPWHKVYHSFKWDIRNGIIYLEYCQERESDLDTFLRDYQMTSDRLTGYLGNSSTYISLRKYEDYYRWDGYVTDYGDYRRGDGYGYYDYYGNPYYYAPSRSANDAAQPTDEDAPRMIRCYNRYTAQQ